MRSVFRLVIRNLQVWVNQRSYISRIFYSQPFCSTRFKVVKNNCGRNLIETWFFVVCTLTDNAYVSLLVSQTFFLYCFCRNESQKWVAEVSCRSESQKWVTELSQRGDLQKWVTKVSCRCKSQKWVAEVSCRSKSEKQVTEVSRTSE